MYGGDSLQLAGAFRANQPWLTVVLFVILRIGNLKSLNIIAFLQTDAAMFGAINRFIARLDSDLPPQSSTAGPGDSSYGFQVLRNITAELPIEPWFDFIVGINGHAIVRERVFPDVAQYSDEDQDDPDPQLFAREVSNCAGHSISLDIWSAKVGKEANSFAHPG